MEAKVAMIYGKAHNGRATITINKNMKSRHTANDILSQAGVRERFR